MIGYIVKKFIGSKNEREVKRLRPLVAQINGHEAELQKLPEKALREKTAQLQTARDETAAKQQRLSKRHDTLTAQVEKDKENREAARQQAKGLAGANSTTNPSFRQIAIIRVPANGSYMATVTSTRSPLYLGPCMHYHRHSAFHLTATR